MTNVCFTFIFRHSKIDWNNFCEWCRNKSRNKLSEMQQHILHAKIILNISVENHNTSNRPIRSGTTGSGICPFYSIKCC